MNISELDKIIEKEAGICICPMCGTPFNPRDARQKTCGTSECKRLWKNKYLRERRTRLIAEDKELFNFRHAEAQRKSRRKKKNMEIADENYRKAQEYWERFEQRHQTDKPDGRGYAERQIAKTLSEVPKIDVSGFGKGKE